MRFNSLEFVLFAIVFFAAWPFLRRRTSARWLCLTVASFFFYGWWDWRFLFLLIGSGMIDYVAALSIVRWPRHAKLLLMVSLAANLGSLGVFKYFNFFMSNAGCAAELFGYPSTAYVFHIALPVGISFYTFQSMSYTIDVYRGQLAPVRNVFHFFAYLSMFPQLVAGPIVRARDLLPQLEDYHQTTEEDRWNGTRLIINGLLKKIVIADSVAPVVNAAFGVTTPAESCVYWWIVMVMFAIQIYCDFSGYSDIARGLAFWMGYNFPVNFEYPYLAVGLSEFWSRWHISLSTWFRDYVYIPLGGSRRGSIKAYRNMWVTMLLSGLWHGASWTFVGWGAVHALYLSVERATSWPTKLRSMPWGEPLGVVATFLLVVIGWVFFRAESFGQAWLVLLQLMSVHDLNFALAQALIVPKALLLTVGMIGWHIGTLLGPEVRWDHRFWQPVAYGLLLAACVFLRGPGQAFIYFQF